ncbi:ferrous iron transport protein A [Candidatus Binatia bacterium]|nr:ferrous iron transport protein A [Candidatus Binatia bacterium]
MTLAHVSRGFLVIVQYVGGDRAFRRRLMELGLVPGTRVEVVGRAPLGDPIELLVRGCSLSIRRGEALCVTVVPGAPATARSNAAPARACPASCAHGDACATPGSA